MKKIFSFYLFLIIAGFLSAVAPDISNAEESRQQVVVSILPLKYFVQKIAKNKVSVAVMVPPGANPHSYEPKPEELRRISTASLYIKVGTPIEFEVLWLKKLISLNPRMQVCDSSKGISLLESLSGGKNSRPDPHTWVSLENDIQMAENIEKALGAIDIANKDFYTKNFIELKKELTGLDYKNQKRTDPNQRKIFHCYSFGMEIFCKGLFAKGDSNRNWRKGSYGERAGKDS